MIDDQPLNIYLKQKVEGHAASTGATSSMPGTVNTTTNMTFTPLKKPSTNRRRIALIVGILAFLILAISGVWIALTTNGISPFAPNATNSKPAAGSAASCTLSFTVAAVVTSPTPTPSASPSPTPTPTPGVTPTPTPNPVYSCNATCTTDAQCQSANADYICSAAQGNTCRLKTNVGSDICQPTVGSYACNSSCTTNTQCASANADYICAAVDGGNFCRLATATSASNCQVPQPTPTPTIGCNQTCISNSDCTNPDHICYNNVCRLQTNPTDQYCAPATTTTATTATTTTTTTTSTQPSLPAELPKTGPADWGLWLKAGLGTLGVGAVLLLFL